MQNRNPVVEWREGLGLKRAEAAQRLGTDYSYLQHIELGYVARLSNTMIERLISLGAPKDIGKQYLDWRSKFAVGTGP